MPVQICRGLRRAAAGNISGRGHDNPALRPGQRHRHHVFWHMVAIAHPGIEARRDNVDRPFLYGEGQAHPGKFISKFRQGGREQQMRRIGKGVDP